MSETRLRLQTDVEKSTTGGSLVVTDVSTKECKYLAPGSDTQILTLVSGTPSWQTPAGGGSSPWTVSSQDMYNSLTGNIGTGTSSPSAKFHLQTNSLGNTPTVASGILLQNTTLATSGNQQISPSLTFEGQGWKTAATATSESKQWRINALPTQSTNGGSSLQFQSNINGGAFGNVMSLSDDSSISFGVLNLTPAGTMGGLYVTGTPYTSAGVYVNSNSTSAINGQRAGRFDLAGANASSNITSYGVDITNSHTGTSSTNYGIKALASGATNNYAALFQAQGGTNNYALATIAGNSGFGVFTPTALVNIAAGSTTAGTAPLKFTTGALNTIAEAGAIEFLTNDLYFTPTTVRKKIALFNNVTPTTTQTLVGNGTDWTVTTATGTGTPVFSISPTFTGTLNAANINATGSITGGGNLNITTGFHTLSSSSATSGGLVVTANSTTTGSGLIVQINNGLAASNTQTGISVNLQGANTTSSQTTYGAQISNAHSGTSSKNVALYLSSTSGTTNVSLLTKGQVGFETTTVDPSSIFDVANSDKGSRPIPSVLNANMLAISSPATGLQVYNTTHNSIFIYNGSNWERVSKGGVSTVPAVSLGTGAGTGAIASINGNSECGYISVTTGSSPVISNVVFTITAANSYAYPLSLMLYLTPGNDVAAELSGKFQVYTTPISGSQARVLSGSTALTAGSTYVWNYIIKGF